MAGPPAEPLSIERNVISALLLALAAAAWGALVWQSRGAPMHMTMDSATMGLPAPLFLAFWVLMMVAMMFPTAMPMIRAFHKGRVDMGQRSGAFVATWVFVAGYLLVWTLAGIVAYAGARAAEIVAARAALSPDIAARIGGSVLVAAGFYQCTFLKENCLAKCRTPNAFIMKSWRDGASGALRMGLLHGVYCLGCCWLLFVILFPLGLMNLVAIAAITSVVLAEKTLPWVRTVSGAMAATLAIYGAIIIAVPDFKVPTLSTVADMAMPMHMRQSRIPAMSDHEFP